MRGLAAPEERALRAVPGRHPTLAVSGKFSEKGDIRGVGLFAVSGLPEFSAQSSRYLC